MFCSFFQFLSSFPKKGECTGRSVCNLLINLCISVDVYVYMCYMCLCACYMCMYLCVSSVHVCVCYLGLYVYVLSVHVCVCIGGCVRAGGVYLIMLNFVVSCRFFFREESTGVGGGEAAKINLE